jgi:hypothetical protein
MTTSIESSGLPLNAHVLSPPQECRRQTLAQGRLAVGETGLRQL